MNDYDKIALVIEHINRNRLEQPSLDELAGLVSLSPYHFQRLFSRWVGVSPKKFLQCLTVESAKRRLQKGDSVLAVALDEGLSGPSRLHDLTVQLEGASPGELKSGGKGLEIEFGFGESPFGNCMLAQTPRGICRLSFVNHVDREQGERELRDDWPNARISFAETKAPDILRRIFRSADRPKDKILPSIRCFVQGTEFQLRVWRALLAVPPGELASYSSIAKLIGSSGSQRAVGTAIKNNPIAFLIPCHRVIRANGMHGNYRWGSIRKQAMLAREIAAIDTLD
ncbi:MAG TPA: 6-O-methylguanine DNA methyltransferase [Planctomycetaceae bacterium]|nr:6-O-methylguanine DNA methyltransferase [Planctomycetaceae bacterium]